MSDPFGVSHASSGPAVPAGSTTLSKALLSSGSLKKVTKLAGGNQFKRGAYGGGKAPKIGSKRKAAFNLGRSESRNV